MVINEDTNKFIEALNKEIALVWVVVASLQLAEEETVLSRLSANISKEEAASLIHDIVSSGLIKCHDK